MPFGSSATGTFMRVSFSMSRRYARSSLVAERDRDAGRAGAGGAADAVDVGLGHVRQIEVDDVRDAVDVDAARRDVGRDQHAACAGLEAGERPLARVCVLLPWIAAAAMPPAVEVRARPGRRRAWCA